MSKDKSAPGPGYPAGYRQDAHRADVFDPALKHLRKAFIKGFPSFDTESRRRLWQQERSDVMRHCLRALARSLAGEQVVLRGSLALDLCFGDQARPARDIDLVVANASVRPDGEQAGRLINHIQVAVRRELSGPRCAPSTWSWRRDGWRACWRAALADR